MAIYLQDFGWLIFRLPIEEMHFDNFYEKIYNKMHRILHGFSAFQS